MNKQNIKLVQYGFRALPPGYDLSFSIELLYIWVQYFLFQTLIFNKIFKKKQSNKKNLINYKYMQKFVNQS